MRRVLRTASLAVVAVCTQHAASLAVTVPEALKSLTCGKCLTVEQAKARFTDDEWAELTDGEVILKDLTGSDEGRSKENEASGVIVWPASFVWNVLTDFESRPKYISTSKEATIVTVDGNRVGVRQKLKFLWEDVRFSVVNTVDPEEGTIRWVMNKDEVHDIADSRGSWQLVPIDEGRHTLVLYRSHTDTGRPVPALIESFVMKTSLPSLIDSLRKEVAKRNQGERYVLPGASSEQK